jgi:hypothetical protein
MKMMLAAVAALLSGCATPMLTSEGFHTIGRGKYDISEKREVWGRALEEFQRHNAIVTVVDYEAGILASGSQPAETIPCLASNRRCDSTVGWQFTMSDDGTSLLSMRRGISGVINYAWGRPASLLGDETKAGLERDTDAILAAIVGQRGTVAPRPSRVADRSTLLPVGANCSKNAECASGQCVLLKCSK